VRVLDLFAGLRGWSDPFAERGHDVLTLDIEPRFGADYQADILTWDPTTLPWTPDIILASPPCEKFSVLAIGKNWLPGYAPRHDGTRTAIRIAQRTAETIELLQPAFWVVENLVGMLRKLHLLPYERRTVTYCQYGGFTRKPTDLWGGFPPTLSLRRMCRNGDPCHVASPRGSTTGIQGDDQPKVRAKDGTRKPAKSTRRGSLENVKREAREHFGTSNQQDLAALRAKIPRELALDVCIAAERDLAAGLRASDYSGRLFA
jgi:hypothetical protein